VNYRRNLLGPANSSPGDWASRYITELSCGETVSFRPRGSSMEPIIKSGQLCTVAPIEPYDVNVGDVVLCEVGGKQYLHAVAATRDVGNGSRTFRHFQIRNNRGFTNGWTTKVYGKLVRVES
jgi:hypothetical protein